MSTHKPVESTTWEVWTYDVWGNANDGYEVNDRYCLERAHEIDLLIETTDAHELGTFKHASPTDKQIRAAFGIRCRFETDGDDVTIYVNRSRDGYPIGEMHCTSHESLSPIRRMKESVQ